ncbi:MAG: DUF6273 domain-containing protein [Clostridium sp.]|nr:DUF6273 domain-containing protein [Clostridium sp.]
MENIKVLRKQETETKEILLGDQILISLNGLGDFTATAHKITDKGVLFIFDDYVVSKAMNEANTNEGGFDESDLKKWIDSVLLEAFPSELKDRIADLSIPTVGELFGHDDEWDNEHFEPDDDEQLPLMKERRNRVAYLKNEWEWGWLRNATKKKVSSAYFASVSLFGRTGSNLATDSYGVRPEFWLVR